MKTIIWSSNRTKYFENDNHMMIVSYWDGIVKIRFGIGNYSHIYELEERRS